MSSYSMYQFSLKFSERTDRVGTMKKLNGYSIAVKLCQYSIIVKGIGIPFSEFCKIFGPIYWEKLTRLEKLYFKRIAIQYNQSPLGIIARRDGKFPSREEFLGAVFGQRDNERNQVLDELKCVVIKIYDLSMKTYSILSHNEKNSITEYLIILHNI